MKERVPNQNELQELEQLVHNGIECSGFLVDLPANLDDSAAVVRAIRQGVDEIRQGAKLHRDYEDPADAAYALGSLWGDELCRAFKWEWVYLQAEVGFEGWAVVSPDRSYACFPHRFIFAKLADPGSDNSIALLFNTIEAGDVPPSSPRKYLTLGQVRIKSKEAPPQRDKVIRRETAVNEKPEGPVFVLFWATDHLSGEDYDATLVKFPIRPVWWHTTHKYEFPERIFFKANFATLQWTDFPVCNPQWPLMSRRMLDTLLSVGPIPHRAIPVIMLDRTVREPFDASGNPRPGVTDERFVAVQLTEHLDAFDWERSEYERSKFAPQLVGRLQKLILKEPADGFPALFRLSAMPGRLFVSAAAREALEKAGIRGVQFWTTDRIEHGRRRRRR